MTRFRPGFIAPGGGLTLAFRASAISSAQAITIPAISAIDDLAFLFDYAENSATTSTPVVPTGFIEVIPRVAFIAKVGAIISYKILVAGDPGASVTGMDGETNDSKVMLVFSGGISSVSSIKQYKKELVSSDPASQNTPGGGAASLVFGVGASRTTLPSFTTNSPAHTEVTSNVLRVGYTVYNGASSTHDIDIGDNGVGNYLSSFRALIT